MTAELNELEDWMLENACEGSGFVADLPQVASRIYSSTDPAELHRRAHEAVIHLVEIGAIELGYERPGGDSRIPDDDVKELLTSDAVWGRGSQVESLLLYWATDEGVALKEVIDSKGTLRSSAVHAHAWREK